MVKAPVNPDVLRWARESANLTIDEVTIKVKKSSEVIEAWEKGLDFPSYAQLEKLAYSIYKRPIAVFSFLVLLKRMILRNPSELFRNQSLTGCPCPYQADKESES